MHSSARSDRNERPRAGASAGARWSRRLLLALLPLGIVAAGATPGGAQDIPSAPSGEGTEVPREPTLDEQLEELRAKVLVLERKGELAAEADAEKAKTGATATASARDGFTLRSNDGRYVFRLRGYLQLDSRYYVDEPTPAATDTLLLRRVRPIFEGTVHERFAFRVMPDFGGGTTTLQEAYLDWTFSPAAVLRVGKFKEPVGLERLQSAADIAFVERALPTSVAPNRDLGIQLGGALAEGRVEYAVGLFNGVVDGGSADLDVNDGKDLAARLWFTPWRATPSALSGLSFGIAATSGDQEATPAAPGLATYRTAGQQAFFSYRSDGTTAGTTIADGERFRLSPQATFFYGPFGLLAEQITSRHEVRRGDATAELENSAFQVTGVWILTGENASYRWYVPRKGWDRSNPDPTLRGWGGVALTARYNAFEADEDSAPIFANPAAANATVQREATGWAIGVDWTLNRQLRVLLDYEVTSFDPFPGGRARDDEKVLFTRFHIGW